MRPISSLTPALNNSADTPSAPAALLFLSRIIATRTSSCLGDGRYRHCRRLVSSVYFSSDVVARDQLCEMLFPYSHRILRICNQFSIFISVVQCTGLRTLGHTTDPLVERPGLIPVSRHLDSRKLASFLLPFLPYDASPLSSLSYNCTASPVVRQTVVSFYRSRSPEHVHRDNPRRTIGSVETGASIQWCLLRQ